MLTHEGWTDWEDARQRLIRGIHQELSNHEPLIIHSSRVIRGQVANVKNGNQNGGSSPYGMCKVLLNELGEAVRIIQRGERIEKPKGWKTARVPAKGTQEYDTVRWIFETFALADASFRGIATDLNARHVPSPGGKCWMVNTVRNILTNPIYRGDYEWGRVSSGDYHRLVNHEVQTVPRPGKVRQENQEPMSLPGTIEPTVSPELWDRCQEKIRERRSEVDANGRRRKPRSAGHLLTGLLFCGHCGGRMCCDGRTPHPYIDKNGKKRIYCYTRYVCRTAVVHGHSRCQAYSIREDKLLPVLVRKLQELYLADDQLELLRAKLFELIEERRGDEPQKLEVLRGRLREIEADIKQGRDNLLRVRDDRVFTELNHALADLVKDRDSVSAEVLRLESASPDNQKADKEVVEKAIEKLRRLGQELANAKPSQLREVFRQMLVRVDLYYEEAKPEEEGKKKWKRFLKGVATLRAQVSFSGYEQGVPKVGA
jgi:hypothetical protein